jgi:hypothetical protein
MARMHRSACRAGYPSGSSRAALQQTRTRPAGGGSLLYDYVADRLRHLHHRSRARRGRALPPDSHQPCANPGGEPTANAPGRCPRSPQRPGAVPHRHRHRLPLRAWRGAPPATILRWGGEPAQAPPLPSPTSASRGRCRSGGSKPRAVARAGPRGPTDCVRPWRSARAAARAVRGTVSLTASPSRGRACGPDAGGGGHWGQRRSHGLLVRPLRVPYTTGATAVSFPHFGTPPGPAIESPSANRTSARVGSPGVRTLPRRVRSGRDGSGAHGLPGGHHGYGHDTRARATGRSSWAGQRSRSCQRPAAGAGSRPLAQAHGPCQSSRRWGN